MSSPWYIARGKQKVGPHTYEEMRQMAASGQLLPSDMVLNEGSRQWVHAGDVPGLTFDSKKEEPAEATGGSKTDGWYFARNGQRFGPFAFEQFRQMAASGLLSAEDMVQSDGGCWVSARLVGGLFGESPGVSLAQPVRHGESSGIPLAMPVGHGETAGRPDRPPQPSLAAERDVSPSRLPGPKGRDRHAGDDRLEGYWYAIIWLSLLVPLVGTWVIVAVSSVMYYVWRQSSPKKANAINLQGWLAFGVAHIVCCLGYAGLAMVVDKTTTREQKPSVIQDRELRFNGGQVLYTPAVTTEEATRLGEYLVAQKFFDGQPKTVQLDRRGNAWEFRMVLKKGFAPDEEYIDSTRAFGLQLSEEVFHSAPVEIHLCDEHLKAVRVVTPEPLPVSARDKDSLVQYTGKRETFRLWLVPGVWKRQEGGAMGDAEAVFEGCKGEAWASVVFEQIRVPLGALKVAVLKNMQVRHKEARIVREETRRVNGKAMMCLTLESVEDGVPFTFHGYYYSDDSGTLQVTTWTGRNLFQELKPELERFLNGLEVGIPARPGDRPTNGKPDGNDKP